MSNKGFSVIEILVSLIVVTLAAVNMTGLQKKISEQQRNNIAHSAVIGLATEKMEGVLSLTSSQSLISMHGVSETDIKMGNVDLSLLWSINDVDEDMNAGTDLKEVTLDVAWVDAVGGSQQFSYSEHVNLALLLSGASDDEITDQLAGIIASTLETNEVIYFEPKMGYKKGSFVIYDSYLYEATSVHSVGNGHPRTVTDPETGIESGSDGWKSYGRIDNPELANNPDLATLFLE